MVGEPLEKHWSWGSYLVAVEPFPMFLDSILLPPLMKHMLVVAQRVLVGFRMDESYPFSF